MLHKRSAYVTHILHVTTSLPSELGQHDEDEAESGWTVVDLADVSSKVQLRF